MIIATFNSTTGWAGKTIDYDDGLFTLEGYGPISATDLLAYDQQGHVAWAYEGSREWVQQMATGGTTTSPGGAVLIGTFTPMDGWAAKTVEYSETSGVFTVQDHGPVTAKQVLKFEAALGHFEWASEDVRAFVESQLDPDTLATHRRAVETALREDAERTAYLAAEEARAAAAAAAADPEQEAFARTGVLATFTPASENNGKRIVLRDGALVLEGQGSITPVEMMAFDRRGELVWTYDPGRTAVANDAAWAEMPAKARATLARNMDPGLVDFVIVGAMDQCLVALPESCIIVKPRTLECPESCIQFAYSDITAVSLREITVNRVQWIPNIEVTTSTYPATSHAWSSERQPERAPNCLPLGSKDLGYPVTRMDELRHRAGLLEAPRDVLALIAGCELWGGEGFDLPVESTHDLVFCQDELLLRRSVDGLPEMAIPYSDITLLEVGLPSVMPTARSDGQRSSRGVFGQISIHQMTGFWSRVKLQTSGGELFFDSRYHPKMIVQLELSPVFKILRQRQLTAKSTDGTQEPEDDVVAHLAKLAELHDAGKLTDEEFAVFKAKLMG